MSTSILTGDNPFLVNEHDDLKIAVIRATLIEEGKYHYGVKGNPITKHGYTIHTSHIDKDHAKKTEGMKPNDPKKHLADKIHKAAHKAIKQIGNHIKDGHVDTHGAEKETGGKTKASHLDRNGNPANNSVSQAAGAHGIHHHHLDVDRRSGGTSPHHMYFSVNHKKKQIHVLHAATGKSDTGDTSRQNVNISKANSLAKNT